MDKDEWEMLKLIAEDKGLALARQYSEEQTAHFLEMDVSTLKRLRRNGKIRIALNMGERKIRYLGLEIAKLILKGIDGDGAR